MQAVCVGFVRYARPEGGTAAPFFKGKNVKWLVVTSWVISFLVASLICGYEKTAILFCSGTIITVIFLVFCTIRIGGITGDCIGACSEIVQDGILFCGIFLI
jgi:cobalamin synthase